MTRFELFPTCAGFLVSDNSATVEGAAHDFVRNEYGAPVRFSDRDTAEAFRARLLGTVR